MHNNNEFETLTGIRKWYSWYNSVGVSNYSKIAIQNTFDDESLKTIVCYQIFGRKNAK